MRQLRQHSTRDSIASFQSGAVATHVPTRSSPEGSSEGLGCDARQRGALPEANAVQRAWLLDTRRHHSRRADRLRGKARMVPSEASWGARRGKATRCSASCAPMRGVRQCEGCSTANARGPKETGRQRRAGTRRHAQRARRAGCTAPSLLAEGRRLTHLERPGQAGQSGQGPVWRVVYCNS